MKERPILFSAPMVRALLDGSKTQTRRVSGLEVINAEPGRYEFRGITSGPGIPHFTFHDCKSGAQVLVKCRQGQPSDRLWVRETFFAFGRWETRFSAKKGRDEWHFVDMTLECARQYGYPATGPRGVAHKRDSGITPTWWKRPAIFMPRWASRITLEITGVRVERLQDISCEDAIAEGCKSSIHLPGGRFASENYAWLWDEINGPGSWDANQWVWVIEFKRIEQ